jgi:uncharacterized membrane protein
MEYKKVFGIPLFYLLSIVYAILTTILGIIMNNGLIVFLGWNVILATFVFFLAQMFVYSRLKKQPFWLSYVIFILFILFFPNTFYLLTDTIHFQAYTFFEEYPALYAWMIEDWIVFMIVTIGMLYGVKLGISAIDFMQDVEFPLIKKNRTLYLLGLFILSSIGIYLGRFIRLNSWNILDVERIIFGILDPFTFFIQFVFLFTLIQGFGYFLFSSKVKILYNHTKESEE